jgi:hypothetical protein
MIFIIVSHELKIFFDVNFAASVMILVNLFEEKHVGAWLSIRET